MNDKQNPLWRVFCAVLLPDELRARIASHIARLREAAPDAPASWEKPENLHLTLKFIGEIKEERVIELSEAAERVANECKPFDLLVGETGAFHTRGKPRVLWIGVEDESGELARMHKSLESECATLGYAPETRPYHPHLTVARLNAPESAKALAALHRDMEFARESFRVEEVVVMRSETGPGGSRYTLVSCHHFRDSSDKILRR